MSNQAKTDRNLVTKRANVDARFSFSEEIKRIVQKATRSGSDTPPPPPSVKDKTDG